ncbi:serine-rich adhesin for platelets-like isoform X2 [Macrobrachium rosenbergii]|uniref:serine-rich adhesin for platelets-like isoform X2 n=1 Tax=Macrobrachium rosenbergii TaxID=79674 RepID=UPI0034D751CF
MDEPDADMKAEAGVEGEGGVRYQDPFLVPTAVLLARREVASRYPQATVNQLHRVTEETLVYREYSQTSCQLPGAPKATFLMVFSPDGSKVASTHGDHNIYVSEVKTGQCICTLEGHPRTPWCIAFHPASNEIIASGCLGGEVRVWDLKGGSEVWTTEKDTVIASLAFHPTDQVLVIATFNEIYFWDWFQPEPFATISTGDEKEKVRYVKFDPLGHKLITGIANTSGDRSPQAPSRVSGTNSSPPLSRLELVAREIRLSHRYNQLSSRFRDLMSRYEALTSTALNNNSQTTSRVDRGTDPIEPPPTLGQQALLNQARQFAQQVTEEQRASSRDQDPSPSDGAARGSSTWPTADAQSNRESQTTGDSNLRLDEDYGLSAVRTLRQIISDDSASSSSLDSSSSATSGASGVSERNTRLSLLWTSRLQRPGIDSDSAGEASSVHSSGDTNAVGGAEARPLQSGDREGASAVRPSENSGGSEFRHFRGSDGQGSDDDEGLANLDLPSDPLPDRTGTLWGYYSSRGVIPAGRNRATQERLSASNVYNDDNNNTTGSSFLPLFVNNSQVDNGENSSEGTRNTQSLSVDNRTFFDRGRTSTRDPALDTTEDDRSANSSRSSHRGGNRDRDEDLAVPGPSGLSSISRASPSLQASHRYSNSSTIDPQFGVRLLSGHIENMQRICRAHLEITRHRHEIRRLEQIRSMLYDIQRQIHSLRASVDQSIEDLSGSLGDIAGSPSQVIRPNEEDTASSNTNTTGASPRSLCHRPRTAPRSVARLQRGPFGTRTRSRHAHSSWSMSPSVFRRIPRLRSVRTRCHLPGLCTPLRGANSTTNEPNRERLPPRAVTDQLDHTPLTGAVVGPLPTPPPDERHALRIVSGDSNLTQTRTMLRHNFEQLQERLRERQEALEQQERRLRGFLGNSPSSSSSTTSSAVSSPSLDYDDDPPSPPERIRRSRPPTTSLSSRIANMLAHQAANANSVSGLETNTVQLCNVRRRLRQSILNARRDMLVGRTPGRAGGPILFPASRVRSRNSNAERIHVLIREGLRREQRDHYRQILRHMADRLNSLVNQEQEQQQDEQAQRRQGEDHLSDNIPNSGHLSGDLRLLVRLALHLIDQLTNFICNQNISYEERPISRLPNPFRDEEMGASGEASRSDIASSIDLDLSPGLHNLTTLFETVRMASEELRNDEGGGSENSSTQESTRPITNVPRRLTDFLRRSGNLAQQQNMSSGNEASGTRSTRANTSSVPQLVIPRITLSDPSGSESQVEDDAASNQPSRTSYNDRAEFSTRSVSGVPLRLLGRQYAVDRRSPDSEDNPSIPEVLPDALYHSPDPIPWRGPYDLRLLRGPGSEMLFRPNIQRVPPDRAAEREADNFFSRPYYASHPASRTMTASLQTHRIQAWDFTNYQIPDISDSLSNLVVGKCKIHNDASVDVSADGTLLAALVPESEAMIMVGVYSLENRSLGQLLYSYIFAPNTICVSLSPVARHLVVGFCSQIPRLLQHHNTKQVVAQIYKLCDNPMFHRQGQAGHLQFLRDIEVACDHRHTSLNCIRWLPYPGQGLIYGNNRGHLNILR